MDYWRFTVKFQVSENCDEPFFFSSSLSFFPFLSIFFVLFWGGWGGGGGGGAALRGLEKAKAKEKGKKGRFIVGSITTHKELTNLS